jgi:ribose 1,5-bisphosphokinase PhnN
MGPRDAGHDALITLYRNRFAEQIEVVNTEVVASLWLDVP